MYTCSCTQTYSFRLRFQLAAKSEISNRDDAFVQSDRREDCGDRLRKTQIANDMEKRSRRSRRTQFLCRIHAVPFSLNRVNIKIRCFIRKNHPPSRLGLMSARYRYADPRPVKLRRGRPVYRRAPCNFTTRGPLNIGTVYFP